MQSENENLTNDFNESSGVSGEKRVCSMNLTFDKSDFELNLDLGAKSPSRQDSQTAFGRISSNCYKIVNITIVNLTRKISTEHNYIKQTRKSFHRSLQS